MSKENDPRVVRVALNMHVLKIGSGYIATGSMAGMEFRGTRQETRTSAVHALFYQFTNGNSDAELALDLAVSGEDYGVIERDISAAKDEMKAIGSGSESPSDTPAPSAEDHGTIELNL